MSDDETLKTELKGLQIAEQFFHEWGLPYLRSEFPQISERVVCFVCGGSQSLGNDDRLSHDHGWGPSFQVVLTGDDFRRWGRRLSRAINECAPRQWAGAEYRGGGDSIWVQSLHKWFTALGAQHSPKRPMSWLRLRECDLYIVRHMTIFHDPLGEFTARKEAFHYYPYRAWLQRIADETFNVWHHGEYNFIDRMVYRRDPAAIAICIGTFVESTMKLCMLLEEDYSPYWKWLPAQFRKLPGVSKLDHRIDELVTSSDIERQATLVKTICRDIFSRLAKKGLVTGNPDDDEHCLKIAKNDLRRLLENTK